MKPQRLAWVLGTVAMLVSCAAEPPPKKLNDIVLVVLDTVRASDLGAYGQPLATTPHLDRFSRRAMLHPEAVAPSPWTKPTVATLLTGLSPREHGVRRGLHRDVAVGNRVDVLPDDIPTLAERARLRGYWPIGLQSNPHLKSGFGFGRGFEVYLDKPFHNAEALTDLAQAELAFQQNRSVGKLLYLHLLDPHAPYRPRPAPFLDAGTPEVTLEDLQSPPDDPLFVHRARLTHLAELRFADEQLGRLLTDGNTRFLVTADHGEEFAEHGAFEHGHSMFDELLRVPLLYSADLPGLGPSVPLRHAHTVLDAWIEDRPAPEPDATPMVSEAILYGEDRIALRQGRLKLVAELPSGEPQTLYDLERDPTEIHPLPPHHPLAGPLTAALGSYLEDHPPRPHVPYQPVDPETEAQLKSLGYTP